MSERRGEEERTETPRALVGTYLAALPSRCLMSMSGTPAVKKASAALSSVWLSRSECPLLIARHGGLAVELALAPRLVLGLFAHLQRSPAAARTSQKDPERSSSDY